MDCTIRKYKASDKENLRYICRETAGDYFRTDKKILNAVSVIYSDYFTENEAENIFVIADKDNNAVGYILCSTDYELFKKKMRGKYIPDAVKTSIKMLPVCLGYMTAFLTNGKENSTHLHIDILPDYQHIGLGSQLIDTLRDYLCEKGITKLSVNTIDRTESAYKFYMKYGFKENRHYVGSLYSLTIPTSRRE